MEQHFTSSTFREKLIEHLFIGELLKISWLRGECSLEVAKPEVDNRGYDVIMERAGVVRHVQLKTSHRGALAASQNVHVGLEDKPAGCVVWIQFDEASLALGPFLFYGGVGSQKLPALDGFRVAKHTKANASGVKAERPGIRKVPKGRFQALATVDDVFAMLFGPPYSQAKLKQLQDGLHAVINARLAEFALVLEEPMPRLGQRAPTSADPAWFPVRGMYGGFSYWVDGAGSDQRLIVESWSRVDEGSGQRHVVGEEGVALLDEGFV